MAQALAHLPDIGYIRVLKTSDGTNRTYSIPSNDTVDTYAVWEWEVTFVTKGGDLPLMAAVWWDGRTSTGQDDSFGRSARLTCASCEPFENGTWSSTAEAVVGNRMEVSKTCHTDVPKHESLNYNRAHGECDLLEWFRAMVDFSFQLSIKTEYREACGLRILAFGHFPSRPMKARNSVPEIV